ncbi:unnamed protein product [Phytophthora fragariaefolia]|uniref:Unnamed protein product n=1 Tax=Phytophthora fragariaefolia TaxID=1490495 RepID=A0A9W7CQS8_9STRA|nr:unnamed protein product [Phytophthora fragariaefolia]
MTFSPFTNAAIVAFAGIAFQAARGDADVASYDWRVTPVATAFDGVPATSLGINDRPAHEAVIDVQLGQDVEVRVTNELDEPTCLHWHGLRQLGTQEMDGVPGITRCNIGPNRTVTYRFTPDKAGSFWWHSHHGTQYAFGLRGPIVVHAPESQLELWEQDINEEYTIQLDDIYHTSPRRAPIGDTVAINNLARYNYTAAAINNISDCNPTQPLEHFRFRDGFKYRLRLMNMAALAPFEFSIDDHEFRVIAADSESLQASDLINTLLINAGQRYDVVVQAKNASDYSTNPTGSFWMRAKALSGLPWTAGNATTAKTGFNDKALAIVHYKDEEGSEPRTTECEHKTTVSEFAFVPLAPAVLPAVAADRSTLEFDLISPAPGQPPLGFFAIDGGNFSHFEEPTEPPLFSIAGGLTTAELPAITNARAIEYGKHVEVVLVNHMNEQHPFHMHTHAPWVVGSGAASIEDIRSGRLPPLKLQGAMMRDVYTVPPCTTADDGRTCVDAGYLVLRFTADNPGLWIMHCHIDWHLADGLAMVFVEGEDQLQKAGAQAFANSVLSVCNGHADEHSSNATL